MEYAISDNPLNDVNGYRETHHHTYYTAGSRESQDAYPCKELHPVQPQPAGARCAFPVARANLAVWRNLCNTRCHEQNRKPKENDPDSLPANRFLFRHPAFGGFGYCPCPDKLVHSQSHLFLGCNCGMSEKHHLTLAVNVSRPQGAYQTLAACDTVPGHLTESCARRRQHGPLQPQVTQVCLFACIPRETGFASCTES